MSVPTRIYGHSTSGDTDITQDRPCQSIVPSHIGKRHVVDLGCARVGLADKVIGSVKEVGLLMSVHTVGRLRDPNNLIY